MGSGVNGRGLSRYAAWPLLCALFWLTACGDEKSQAEKAPKPPSVIVAEAMSQTVPVRREFVGNTAAVKRVEIRAKVQGYLEERPFTEGADVKKGDILFVIDNSGSMREEQAALVREIPKLIRILTSGDRDGDEAATSSRQADAVSTKKPRKSKRNKR